MTLHGVAAFCLPRSPLFEIARVLVYSDASLVNTQKLAFGDNQFLLEIESAAKVGANEATYGSAGVAGASSAIPADFRISY